VTSTFEVLAEESRRRILDLLVEEEKSVGDLVDVLSLSQPAVSKHLKVLRRAGLVDSRSEAQRRIYRVRPEPLRDVDEWLEPYRRAWNRHLSALERHLDTVGPPETGSPR
jgi:DNA-binding transcriptional ArsR family regulator